MPATPLVHTTESVFQRPQLGVETVYGTGVAATIALSSSEATLQRKVASSAKQATGYILPVEVQIGKEWSEVKLKTTPSYNVAAGTASKVGGDLDHLLYSIDSDAAVDPVTLTQVHTVETGGHSVPGCVVTGWELTGNQDDMSMNFDLIGKKAIVQAATGSLTPVVPTAFLPSTVAITLATVAIPKLLSYRISCSNLWAVAHFLGSADVANIIQTAGNGEFEVMFEANAANLALLADIGAGSFAVLWKVETGTTPSKMTFSLAFSVQFGEPNAFSDSGGVYAVGMKGTIVSDVTVVLSKS